MGYAVVPPAGRENREALANARWQQILAAKPELGAAVALQRSLIRLVDALSATFGDRGVPRLSLPPGYLTAKLRSGIPALTGEPVQLPVETIRPTLVALCRALAEGGGGDATLQIRAAVDEHRLDIGALLTLALRREQGALRVAATRAGLRHDLLWLVADLAVSPFVHVLLERLFDAADPASPLGVALAQWTRGYCPLCGSWPGVIEQTDGRQLLRCGLCAAAWDAPAAICIYCGESGERLSTIVPDPARPERSAHTCAACRGYTKTLPVDRLTPFPLLALADLDSMDLDLAAMSAGCARPALKQFTRR